MSFASLPDDRRCLVDEEVRRHHAHQRIPTTAVRQAETVESVSLSSVVAVKPSLATDMTHYSSSTDDEELSHIHNEQQRRVVLLPTAAASPFETSAAALVSDNSSAPASSSSAMTRTWMGEDLATTGNCSGSVSSLKSWTWYEPSQAPLFSGDHYRSARQKRQRKKRRRFLHGKDSSAPQEQVEGHPSPVREESGEDDDSDDDEQEDSEEKSVLLPHSLERLPIEASGSFPSKSQPQGEGRPPASPLFPSQSPPQITQQQQQPTLSPPPLPPPLWRKSSPLAPSNSPIFATEARTSSKQKKSDRLLTQIRGLAATLAPPQTLLVTIPSPSLKDREYQSHFVAPGNSEMDNRSDMEAKASPPCPDPATRPSEKLGYSHKHSTPANPSQSHLQTAPLDISRSENAIDGTNDAREERKVAACVRAHSQLTSHFEDDTYFNGDSHDRGDDVSSIGSGHTNSIGDVSLQDTNGNEEYDGGIDDNEVEVDFSEDENDDDSFFFLATPGADKKTMNMCATNRQRRGVADTEMVGDSPQKQSSSLFSPIAAHQGGSMTGKAIVFDPSSDTPHSAPATTNTTMTPTARRAASSCGERALVAPRSAEAVRNAAYRSTRRSVEASQTPQFFMSGERISTTFTFAGQQTPASGAVASFSISRSSPWTPTRQRTLLLSATSTTTSNEMPPSKLREQENEEPTLLELERRSMLRQQYGIDESSSSIHAKPSTFFLQPRRRQTTTVFNRATLPSDDGALTKVAEPPLFAASAVATPACNNKRKR